MNKQIKNRMAYIIFSNGSPMFCTCDVEKKLCLRKFNRLFGIGYSLIKTQGFRLHKIKISVVRKPKTKPKGIE